MNCKLKHSLGFALYFIVACIAIKYVPQEWGGYGAMVLFSLIFGGLFFAWIVSMMGRVRNPYQGAQRLRQQARKIAADDGIDINTAAHEVWDQAQAKGQTYPKRELDTMPRPVMADRAHINHIRHNETMPLAGYDKAQAKDPELPAGTEVEGIWVDVTEKKPIWRHDG